MNQSDLQAHLEEVTKTVLTKLGMDAVIGVEAMESDGKRYFDVDLQIEDGGSELIGRYGSTLESLTGLLNAMVISAGDDEEQWRVIVDVNGYRQERSDYIEQLAEKAISQVRDTMQSFDLSPMKAWERRIVHMVVSKYPELATRSEGEGIDRHVVIDFAG